MRNIEELQEKDIRMRERLWLLSDLLKGWSHPDTGDGNGITLHWGSAAALHEILQEAEHHISDRLSMLHQLEDQLPDPDSTQDQGDPALQAELDEIFDDQPQA